VAVTRDLSIATRARALAAADEPAGPRGLSALLARAAVATSGELALGRDLVLRSFAQIFFGGSRLVGLMLLLATALSPRLFLAGVCSILVAAGVARLLRLSPDQIRSGLLTYNALLVGLGGAALLEPTPVTILLIVLAVAASVLVTTAMNSALGSHFNLPILTLPFLAVLPVLLATATSLGGRAATLPPDPISPYLGLPAPLALLLQSLGAVFFLPRVDAGLLVLAGLVIYSRVGALLAVVGFALSQLLAAGLSGSASELLPPVLGYNAVFTALAMGGVWFVPSAASFALAAGAALVSGLLTIGLTPFLSWNGLPPLILPFNLTVLTLLYAMRQRVEDRAPKSVDFLLGTPEENLAFFRTRLNRFGNRYAARISAPFLGRWLCTQGEDGEHTHKGPWRHALDFEVAGGDGRVHRGLGDRLEQYHCYKLPVLAVGDGTVVKVIDGVADNEVGEVNLDQNWGNLVLICHATGLYSLVCHLSPGTLKVAEGQVVKRGEVLGLCGNSGRSPVPHLHFHLQGTARVGAPTLPVELHHVVREGAEPELFGTLVPDKGDVVRNLKPDEELGRLVTFQYGEAMAFSVELDGAAPVVERVTPDIDIYGALLLRSDDREASLFYDLQESHFTVLDALGHRRSVLHLIQAALARMPLEAEGKLVWRDHLSPRHHRSRWIQLVLDLAAPFTRLGALEMAYHARRVQGGLIIRGSSTSADRQGEALLSTEAVLSDGLGLQEITVTARGRTVRARRLGEQETGGDHENR